LIAGMGRGEFDGTSDQGPHDLPAHAGRPEQRVQHQRRAACASTRVGPCTTSAVAGSGSPRCRSPRAHDHALTTRFGIVQRPASARFSGRSSTSPHRRPLRRGCRRDERRRSALPATATPISITCLKGDSARAPRSAEAARRRPAGPELRLDCASAGCPVGRSGNRRVFAKKRSSSNTP